MRGLIVLCFVAVAFAAPQYNYEQQHGGGVGGGFGAGAGSAPSQSFAQAGPSVYNKQFYIHSAPEDALDDATSQSSSSLSNQRNLRVVFIKAPENKGLENAALNLAKSASDQQTAIYVLNKQTDLGDLERKLAQSTNQNANKPEVHFVKYKTPEEAEHAQHTIQAQYNSLAGPSSVSNEGVAPVQSFVGSVPSSGHGHGGFAGAASNIGGGSQGYLPPVSPNQNYLPPAFIRRF